MADKFTVTGRNAQGKAIGYAGADTNAVGKYASGAELSYEAFKQQFDQSYPGASGIAGGNVKASPAYKDALAKAWASFQSMQSQQQPALPQPMQNMQGAAGDISQILGLSSNLPGGQGDALASEVLRAFSQQR